MSSASSGISQTLGCVNLLIDCSIDNALGEVVVQVIAVEMSLSVRGNARCVFTISDGNHFMECYLAPQLLPLVSRKRLKKYSVVRANSVVCSTVSDKSSFIMNIIKVIADEADVINEPVAYEPVRVLSSSLDCSNKTNSVNVNATRVKFRAVHEASLSGGSEGDQDGKEEHYVCYENCNSKPCDWTEYGQGIIAHIENKVKGHFMDSHGNIIDAGTDSCTPITNKQLRYIAYGAYTLAKHGYLG
jgi:hypothetical protein